MMLFRERRWPLKLDGNARDARARLQKVSVRRARLSQKESSLRHAGVWALN